MKNQTPNLKPPTHKQSKAASEEPPWKCYATRLYIVVSNAQIVIPYPRGGFMGAENNDDNEDDDILISSILFLLHHELQ